MASRVLAFLSVLACAACAPQPAPTLATSHPAPSYSAGTILPDGSREPAPIGPGMIMSIYGTHLGPAVACAGEPHPTDLQRPNPVRPHQTAVELQLFPTRLCDTEVRVGGVPAGLLYVHSGQINFQTPQTAATSGTTIVQAIHAGTPGPLVTLDASPAPVFGPASALADRIWDGLQAVRWNTQYPGGCAAVPAHQGLRYGLYGHVYYCAAEAGGVVAESFYFPADRDPPTVRLQRADFRLPVPYPPMSSEVEQVLAERLTRAYGPGSVPENVFGTGAYRPNPGLSWRAGDVTIFLHRNRNHVAPAGVRQGVQLVAVRQEVLDERDRERQAREALVPFVRTEELRQELGPLYPEAGAATLHALLELLTLVGTGGTDRNALLLAAADSLAVRLGEELVSRSVQHAGEVLAEAPQAAEARERLRPYGVAYAGIGHYSGALEYDRSLLLKAWTGSPATPWGQRAFLEIQRLGCSVPGFGCDGVNCFLEVIRQGERFLLDFPDTPFRLEQTYHLALAHEAWWSLSQAAPDDITAQGARVDARSGEAARLRAITLYEELLRLAPNSPQAQLGQLTLPRLRLRLDTAERTFFCWSC